MWIDGAIERRRYEHNELAWLAWHTAALTRISAKKWPKLETLQNKPAAKTRPKKRRQTSAELEAIMRSWAKAHNERFGNGKSR